MSVFRNKNAATCKKCNSSLAGRFVKTVDGTRQGRAVKGRRLPVPLRRRPADREARLMAPRLLRVKLFVCPEPSCRQIGKRPISDIGGKVTGFCIGSIESPHRKRKMEPVPFVEDRR